MSPTRVARTSKALAHRKTRDRALVLPLVGLMLLLPPVAGIFQVDALVAGVPVTLVYLFSVWAVLIAVAALLSRRLRAGNERASEHVSRESAGARSRSD